MKDIRGIFCYINVNHHATLYEPSASIIRDTKITPIINTAPLIAIPDSVEKNEESIQWSK